MNGRRWMLAARMMRHSPPVGGFCQSTPHTVGRCLPGSADTVTLATCQGFAIRVRPFLKRRSPIGSGPAPPSQERRDQDYAASCNVQPLTGVAPTISIRHSPGFGIAAKIVRGNTRDSCCFGVRLDALPNDLFAQPIACHPVGAIHGPKNTTIRNARRKRPRADRHFHPRWHRRGADPAVLAHQVHDAPATVPLLEMRESQCGHF